MERRGGDKMRVKTPRVIRGGLFCYIRDVSTGKVLVNFISADRKTAGIL